MTEDDAIPSFDAQLAERLHTLRVRRGLSSAELARAIGVSFRRVRRFESGLGRLDAASLWKLSQALNVSVDELAGPTGPLRSTNRARLAPGRPSRPRSG
jgi:transcriptional regulator with XRE-family HTH domain